MTESTRTFFQGFNIRELKPLNELTHYNSRQEAIEDWHRMIVDAQDLAVSQLPIDASEADKRNARFDAQKEVYRRLGKTSTFFLGVFILQEEWLNTDYTFRLCLEADQNKWGDKLWVIAREHLKSTILTCLSTLREILEDPERTFLIFSFKVDIAMGFLSIIKGWCESKVLLKELYPDVIWENPEKGYADGPDGDRVTWEWNKSAIEVRRKQGRKEKTVEVSGITGGGKTSTHFSHLIYDDVETIESMENPEYVQKFVENITNSFNCGQSNNLNICMIGTFYAREDMYCRLVKQGIIKEAIIQPCYDENGQPVYYSREVLLNKQSKMTPSVFATQMMCDPSMNSSSAFNQEWWRTWEPNDLHRLNIYMFVDPAGTPTNKSDRTAMGVIGLDGFGNRMVIDMEWDKMTLDTKCKKLFSLYQRYRPIRVYYERVGMQADIQYMYNQMEQLNLRFPIVEYKPNGSKTSRINVFQVEVMNGRWYFPKELWKIDWQGQQTNIIHEFFINEFLAYPTGQHDDGLDMFSQCSILEQKHEISCPDASTIMNGRRIDVVDADWEEIEEDPLANARRSLGLD